MQKTELEKLGQELDASSDGQTTSYEWESIVLNVEKFLELHYTTEVAERPAGDSTGEENKNLPAPDLQSNVDDEEANRLLDITIAHWKNEKFQTIGIHRLDAVQEFIAKYCLSYLSTRNTTGEKPTSKGSEYISFNKTSIQGIHSLVGLIMVELIDVDPSLESQIERISDIVGELLDALEKNASLTTISFSLPEMAGNNFKCVVIKSASDKEAMRYSLQVSLKLFTSRK
jgi:hypothetical protein